MEKAVLLKKSTVLLTYIGMLCQGKPQYEAVREMMDDPDYYKYALGIFMEESDKYNNVSFIIKRNPKQESKEEWLGSVSKCCQNIQHPRDGKTVYIGQTFRDVTYSLSDNEEKTVGIRTIYEITERTIDRYGQYFIVPDIELGTYWTNTSLPDETVIDLYHAHEESEQYHSEIKTDMDVERLPSGKFESNKLVLELTMIAYNILRIIGQESLEIYTFKRLYGTLYISL